MVRTAWVLVLMLLVAWAFWKLSAWKWKGRPQLPLSARILLAVLFPFLLAMIVLLGSLVLVVLLGLVTVALVLWALFRLMGRKNGFVIWIRR